jgi:hypothetical protein
VEAEEAEAQVLQVKRDALAELTEADAHSQKVIEAKLKRQELRFEEELSKALQQQHETFQVFPENK